jgi:hypothetical protein
MDDRRVMQMLACAAAHRSEAARLEAEVDAVLAARAAGVSPWGSELPQLFLHKVLELLHWDPAVCGVMRAVCSSWSDIIDALLPRLLPLRSLSVTMEGKLGWFESVTVVDLRGCENGGAGVLPELRSMPSLRSLVLPASCAERAVDAEALCGLTTVTTLSFCTEYDEDGEEVAVGEWVLDLSRLPTLTSLNLMGCGGVTDKEVLALSNLPGFTDLNLFFCNNVTSEALRALSSLTALTTLNLTGCDGVTAEVLRAVSSLTKLNTLNLCSCHNVTTEGLRVLSSLTKLNTLNLRNCFNVSTEGLRAVSSLKALTDLDLSWGPNVTDEVLRAVSSLKALTTLDLSYCGNGVTAEGLNAVSSLTALSTLSLSGCNGVTDEVLQTLSCLTALSTLTLYGCDNATAPGKQALRTAIPNLTIEG